MTSCAAVCQAASAGGGPAQSVAWLFLPDSDAETALLLFAGGAVVLVGLAVVAWLVYGRPPRRRRAYERALRKIGQKRWQEALAAVRELQALGPLSAMWQGRTASAESQCHRLAAEIALQEQRYEEALDHHLAAACAAQPSSANQGHPPTLPSPKVGGGKGVAAADDRDRVVQAMLAQTRRLFATVAPTADAAVQELTGRILHLKSPCPEASFWQGLAYARQGRMDQALASLRESVRACEPDRAGPTPAPGSAVLLASHSPATSPPLDAVLYLAAILQRTGQTPEALRYLSEANRLDPDCPFVTWQLGMALAAAGKHRLAVRALQRALGSEGLPRWSKAPHRAWLEGFPEPPRSFVRRLAAEHTYRCPVLGNDIAALIRQGQLALAQAHYQLGNFQEAANVYTAMLQESPPSLPVIRGLGLALARLERYDLAIKHLQAAYEQEVAAAVPAPSGGPPEFGRDPSPPRGEGKSEGHLTAGYLALCGAKGRPLRPEDKANNVRWAIALLARFDKRQDPEWAGVCSAVFAEARAAGLLVPLEDQVRLCAVLASVDACDPAAAAAYEHLARTSPDALCPEHAWLYCRAAQEHGVVSESELELFQRAFQQESAARAFYAERRWDFDEVVFTYLQRHAARRPGSFPEVLGADFPARGPELLLARSRQQEEAGQLDAALATAAVLLRLAPASPRAYDRMAYLHYRRGHLDRAAEILDQWHAAAPADHWPLVRRAVVERHRANLSACSEAIDKALQLTCGRLRGEIAFLGGRLLVSCLHTGATSRDGTQGGEMERHREGEDGTLNGCPPVCPSPSSSMSLSPTVLQRAVLLFEECLQEEPGHVGALSWAAAVRALLGDRDGLARQSKAMCWPKVPSARFQFLAALCQLAAGDYEQALAASRRVAAPRPQPSPSVGEGDQGWPPPGAAETDQTCSAARMRDDGLAAQDAWLAAEACYLRAWGYVHTGAREAARAELQEMLLRAPTSPSADHARALLGKVHFASGAYDQAIECWSRLAPEKRTEWHFDESLGRAAFVAGVLALEEGRFDDAVGNLCQARRLGLHCESLLRLARTRAAQRLLYGSAGQGNAERAVPLLEQAVEDSAADANLTYLLALAYKRCGQVRAARRALQQISRPDAVIYGQMGVLALRDSQLAEAGQDFAQAWEIERTAYEACHNLLLTRLSLGQVEAARSLIGELVALAPEDDVQRLFIYLQSLLGHDDAGPDVALGGMSAADEQRLLKLVRSLGHLDIAHSLLKTLAAARPESAAAREAHLEAVLLKGKALLDRCQWLEAKRFLVPRAREKFGRPNQIIFLNLLGCCACLAQDFEEAADCFTAALRLAPRDARLHQNAALAYELRRLRDRAEPHWSRYLELLDDRLPAPQDRPGYVQRLAFETLIRLASFRSEKGEWSLALSYVQRAHQLQPDDIDTLEKMFYLYQQINHPADARRTLQRMQRLRPNEPSLELYELDLLDAKNPEDIEAVLPVLERILGQYPGDERVVQRATSVLGTFIVLLTRLSQNLTEQLDRTITRIRRLSHYEIDWPEVQELGRALYPRLHRIKRTASKCLALVSNEGQRRTLRELMQHMDRKVDLCRKLGG